MVNLKSIICKARVLQFLSHSAIRTRYLFSFVARNNQSRKWTSILDFYCTFNLIYNYSIYYKNWHYMYTYSWRANSQEKQSLITNMIALKNNFSYWVTHHIVYTREKSTLNVLGIYNYVYIGWLTYDRVTGQPRRQEVVHFVFFCSRQWHRSLTVSNITENLKNNIYKFIHTFIHSS